MKIVRPDRYLAKGRKARDKVVRAVRPSGKPSSFFSYRIRCTEG